MALRRRVSFLSAAAVAVAILLAAFVCYWVVRDQLRGQVDDALRGQAILVQHEGNVGLGGGGPDLPGLPASAGGRAPFAQVVSGEGSVLLTRGGMGLPVSGATRAVATGNPSAVLQDATITGTHLRVFTFHTTADTGGQVVPVAVQLARPLQQVDRVLSHLRLILLLLCAGGIALAAALGRLAAGRVLAPLAEVAQSAQYIGETDDLSHRLKIHAEDEVGQLARRFNAMLDRLAGSRAALDESVRAQRQLVADASHELRTPVTSLRTNIEVLLADTAPDEEERRHLLADVVEQSEELSALVGDLIELARGDLAPEDTEDVRLDRIVEEAVIRARRNSPGVEFDLTSHPVVIEGVPERVSRAVNNLLDNAAAHTHPRGRVEVSVDGTGVRVRDHGDGIPDADLPHVFDRFFRGTNSRGKQGSGLGLSIVRQVAEQHGGSVTAANAPDGGAVFTLTLDQGTGSRMRDPAGARMRAPGPGRMRPGLSGAGGPGQTSLPGDPEALAQEPEADPEDGHDRKQQQLPVALRADAQRERDLDADGGERS